MIRVLAGDELDEGEMKSVQAGGQEIALYRVEGAVYATSNICTHQYAIMTEGYLDGDCIECPLHQALFSIKTGEPVDAPTDIPLPVFETEEKDGGIFVKVLGEPRPTAAERSTDAVPARCAVHTPSPIGADAPFPDQGSGEERE